ncbi:plastocyanin [Sphingomonas jejuensis]|uniref:Plastocyanin n=1 Tax=Sphingomonas jejuensis TaxID=904715 RepID=A0ABX0XRJ7_9SPHN|nr:methylamine utilization protein [Sphingomonas jejuensis]NJC35255.1 plastocyanin [Sphingomonas jejuensis]
MRTFLHAGLLLTALIAPAAAEAATLSFQVRGPGGQPLPGAVVTVEVAGGAAAPVRGPYVMEQRDIQFQPHVLIVPVGASVSFPNRDRVRHHVYSFSRPKRLDLPLYGRDETHSVTFDQPGVVALGCNIHDAMSAFVFVTATPFVAQSGADGRVTLAQVPAGSATVRVWHPSIRARGNSMAQAFTVTAADLASTLTVR